MRHDAKGVEALPIVLLLGAVLGASILAIGFACLDQTQRLNERQRAIDGFNLFIERARMLSAGGVGSVQLVELELGGCKIVLEGELIQLVMGEEVVRSDVLSIPVSTPTSQLGTGTYLIGLKRGADGRCFLELEVA
jgi:hypothetical protein